MTGLQRDMTLTSTDALYGRAEDADYWHILIRYPLPGAASGTTSYVLYLNVPDPGRAERVAYPIGPRGPARGFFYQARGTARGRELIASGFVWLRRRAGDRWLVTLSAEGKLGTRLKGLAVLSRSDLAVRDYIEQRHAGDVADLRETATSRPP